MASPKRFIPLQIKLPADHPALLNGLETWLRLGLISDLQVRDLCQQYLTSPLPTPKSVAAAASSTATQSSLALPTGTEISEQRLPPAPIPRHSGGWVSQFLQRLVHEVSVIWLLSLGVFLVVISSGVLAASQWQHVTPIGQYGILFGYTLAFVIIGLWTDTQPQLRLTSSMLQMTSLLIIPVNFWMMDGFKLLQTPLGLGIAVLASILLSAATARLLPRPKTSTLALINVLGLSWLHWGWSSSWSGGVINIPLLATYIGCIGTSLILLRQQHVPDTSAPQPESANTGVLTEPLTEDLSVPPPPSSWLSQLSPADVLLPFAVLLLLFRACVVAGVPLEQLGLAFGICGWLLCWLARGNPGKRFWAVLGIGLLVMGWLVGATAVVPWQSFLTGGLGLWLLSDRLLRHRLPIDLVGLVVTGLVTVVLGVQIIPRSIRTVILDACVAWAGPPGMPDVLWSIGLYPYLWCLLTLAFWLRRRSSPLLVRTAYSLAWILGGGLVVTSLTNAVVRSVSLGLAFSTLTIALQQRALAKQSLNQDSDRNTVPPSIERPLLSIVHGLGLLAIFSTIDNLAPGLKLAQWGVIALVLMVLEWGTAFLLPPLAQRSRWQENAWYTGLGLAGLGYLLLLVSLSSTANNTWGWNSVALVTPTALTALLFMPGFRWRTQALAVAVISIIAVQPLTFEATPPRLIGLGLGATLMLLCTVQQPNLIYAALSVGFGITFGYAAGWEGLPHNFQSWIALSVGLLLMVMGLRQLCRSDGFRLPLGQALDGWAVALTIWISIPFVVYGLIASANHLEGLPALNWVYPAASIGLCLAWIYRFWQRPAQFWLVGTAWTAEVVLVITLAFWHQPLHTIAIMTLAVGLLSVLFGEAQIRRTGQPYPWGWNLIPLGYGALGWLLSMNEWSSTSGLYTLVVASIALGVGRRQSSLMPVTALGLAGVSVGTFELVLHPLLEAGRQLGDTVLALGALATMLAILGRLLDRRGGAVLNLPPNSLCLYGHLHWGLGSVLAALALSLPLSATANQFWGLELGVLGGYALIRGRQQTFWIYFGLSQIFAAIGQILYSALLPTQLLPWASAIASGLSLALYSLPWVRWGWPKLPFYRFALAVPFIVTVLTAFSVNISSLLLTGGFYGWMAFASQTVRLSYVGLLAANWAALRLLTELHLTSRIWSVSLVGLSILFIAQIDPALRVTSRKELRHWLRCFAVGLVTTTVLYESDPYFAAGLLAIGLSLGLVLMGLLLRIRAFLYVGTLTFIAKVLRLVWLFIADESLVLWALGIVLGLMLIWIAATFEARRAQVTALLQYWVTELEQWQ